MLKVIKKTASLRKALSMHSNTKIGFVPTMGAFHEGHLSLMRKARKQTDIVVVSIFINPMQFAEGEDLLKYPKQIKKDIALATEAGVDYIFVPSLSELYSSGFSLKVEVNAFKGILCDASRPEHFVGVTTIVAKLLNIVNPDITFLGQKDYQQYLLIKRMAKDLDIKSKIISCPIVRESNGLALSSRNVYLSDEEKKKAVILNASLIIAKKNILNGETKPCKVVEQVKKSVSQLADAIDYIAILNADDLSVVKVIKSGKYFIGVAAYFSGVRLIDNILVNVK